MGRRKGGDAVCHHTVSQVTLECRSPGLGPPPLPAKKCPNLLPWRKCVASLNTCSTKPPQLGGEQKAQAEKGQQSRGQTLLEALTFSNRALVKADFEAPKCL